MVKELIIICNRSHFIFKREKYYILIFKNLKFKNKSFVYILYLKIKKIFFHFKINILKNI